MAEREKIQAQVDQSIFFPTNIRVSGREIRFFVPNRFLGGTASGDWAYSVVVTGADVEQLGKVVSVTPGEFSLMVIAAAPGRHMDRFGIVRDADPNQPPVIDLLAPSVEEQRRALSDYDVRIDRFAAVPGHSPSGTEAVIPPGGTVARVPATGSPAPRVATPAPSRPSRPSTYQPEQPSEPAYSTGTQRRTIPSRLRTLNTLLEDGLITETEYQQLRRKLLSERSDRSAPTFDLPYGEPRDVHG